MSQNNFRRKGTHWWQQSKFCDLQELFFSKKLKILGFEMEEPMEESAPEPQQSGQPQDEKKNKVSSILRPGSMGKFLTFETSDLSCTSRLILITVSVSVLC